MEKFITFAGQLINAHYIVRVEISGSRVIVVITGDAMSEDVREDYGDSDKAKAVFARLSGLLRAVK